MRSAVAQFRKWAETGWWMLLLVSITVLAIAALMAELGNERWPPIAGEIAWATAFSGCVIALATGVGRKAGR